MIIPLWMRAFAAVTILTAILGIGWSIHHMIWKSGYNQAMQEVEAKAEADRVFKQEGIDNVSSTFVEKSAKKATVNQVNSERLSNYVTPNDPVLPGCFRLFHDAVAAGKELEYQCRGDAAPVPSATLAATVKANYDGCNKNADQVETLQAIVKKMNGE